MNTSDGQFTGAPQFSDACDVLTQLYNRPRMKWSKMHDD